MNIYHTSKRRNYCRGHSTCVAATRTTAPHNRTSTTRMLHRSQCAHGHSARVPLPSALLSCRLEESVSVPLAWLAHWHTIEFLHTEKTHKNRKPSWKAYINSDWYSKDIETRILIKQLISSRIDQLCMHVVLGCPDSATRGKPAPAPTVNTICTPPYARTTSPASRTVRWRGRCPPLACGGRRS